MLPKGALMGDEQLGVCLDVYLAVPDRGVPADRRPVHMLRLATGIHRVHSARTVDPKATRPDSTLSIILR